jgi:iron(III) transport system substrate-binding protein
MALSRRQLLISTGAGATAIAATQLLRSPIGDAQPQSINLYSARHYNTDNQLYTRFTSQTGIKVNLVEGKEKELVERIKAEGGKSPADILITVDAGNLWSAAQQGLFMPVNSAVLKKNIPANLRDPNNLWFSFSKRARVIMYNRDRIQPSQLSTYEDLANPKWKGRLIIRSSNNIYNQSLVASLIQIHGAQKAEAWCRGVVANFARPPEGNDTAQIEAVAAGVADITLANTYYLARIVESKDPTKQAIARKIRPFFPNQRDRGAHINISGAGVLKTAPNNVAAIQFLEYLASPTAQSFFAKGNNEYPAVSGTPLDTVIAGFGKFKEDTTVNVAAYGKHQAEAIRIMDRVGWK